MTKRAVAPNSPLEVEWDQELVDGSFRDMVAPDGSVGCHDDTFPLSRNARRRTAIIEVKAPRSSVQRPAGAVIEIPLASTADAR